MELRVDRNALRFNQAAIIALLAIAFAAGTEMGRWLVLAVAAVMLVGTAYAPLSLFKQTYRQGFVRAGVLRPNVVAEDPAPHQFAQGLGGFVLVLAFVVLLAGAAVAGWALAAVVVALAAVNLFAGFCLGCFIYFQLERLGVHLPVGGA